MRRAPEHSLQRAAVDYLAAAVGPPGVCREGVLWHSIDHANARDARAGANRKARGVVAGIPDIVLVRAGRLHGLELKSRAGRLSDAQVAYRDALLAAGGDYVVARTLDDVAFALAGWGVPLRCRLQPFLAADAVRAVRRRRAA